MGKIVDTVKLGYIGTKNLGILFRYNKDSGITKLSK